MGKKYIFLMVFVCGAIFLSGCSVLKVTGKTAGLVGKVGVATVKTAGKVAGKTLVLTGKGVRTVVNMAAGKHIIKLNKKGNSLLVDTLLNRRIKTKLLLDTGCTDTQISEEIARKLGLVKDRGEEILCKLADGRLVSGRVVNIREVRLGRARVYNVRAVVLTAYNKDEYEGLLGMSFLNNFVFRVDSEKEELVLHRR